VRGSGSAAPSSTRASTLDIGRRGEERACRALTEAGYRVLERNLRLGRDELDVVAMDGEVLCFVEVRTRESARFGRAEETVGARKRARIFRAARRYLVGVRAPWPRCRFDVVAITGHGDEAEVTLIRGAFEARY